MASIDRAVAIANNEVAYLAWTLDVDNLDGCLGFHIVREILDANGNVTEEKPLASYVAFRGQSNPDWQPQNTTVWPVQKFTWRDLTLRRRRDQLGLRPANESVRYRIRAVGPIAPGLDPVVVVQEQHWDPKKKKRIDNTYTGTPIPLGYLTEPAWTNPLDVTCNRPPFTSSFTNGILSTQFLVRVINEDGVVEPNELEKHLRKTGDPIRRYLSGDVLTLITDFFKQTGGTFYAALYELEDEELLNLLLQNANQLELILSDAGETPANKKTGTKATYDTRNLPSRKKLRAADRKPGNTFKMHDRMFSGSDHIGHNKFVLFVDKDGVARSVLTGSTNWTWSGVSGQSNNCIRIDDDNIAAAYLAYWQRLLADPQPMPKPPTAKAVGANQSDVLKTANRTSKVFPLAQGGSIETWFSPNMPGKQAPPGKDVKKPPGPPPDMDRLFSLMRKARRAIFFLVFLPSRGGVNSIVSQAVALGENDTTLEVVGAISDTQAMWGYEASTKTADGKKIPAWSPFTYVRDGVSVVRASALTDGKIKKELGDFKFDETLTLGKAIIHDKILVIDPMDPVHCVVAFGSHNLGYKASYSNDENLVIVQGHQALAQAYATHVLDVYDHYRFRAVTAETGTTKTTKKAKGTATHWDGFLCPDETWQQQTGRRLSRYFTEK